MNNLEPDKTRMFLYDLLKSFFIENQDEAKFNEWKKIFSDLKKKNLEINETFEKMLNYFQEVFEIYDIEKFKNEYYELFVNPFNDNLIHLTASYYIDGKNYGNTLVKLRDFLWEKRIEKSKNLSLPEDSLIFTADVMIYLIQNQNDAKIEYGYKTQQYYFSTFLEPFYSKLSQSLKNHENAYFYACVGLYIDFLIDLEKSYFNEVI